MEVAVETATLSLSVFFAFQSPLNDSLISVAGGGKAGAQCSFSGQFSLISFDSILCFQGTELSETESEAMRTEGGGCEGSPNRRQRNQEKRGRG